MDLYWRRKCPACRLKKCKAVGMKPEFVVNKPKSNSRPKKIEKLPKILRIVLKFTASVHKSSPDYRYHVTWSINPGPIIETSKPFDFKPEKRFGQKKFRNDGSFHV